MMIKLIAATAMLVAIAAPACWNKADAASTGCTTSAKQKAEGEGFGTRPEGVPPQGGNAQKAEGEGFGTRPEGVPPKGGNAQKAEGEGSGTRPEGVPAQGGAAQKFASAGTHPCP